MENWTEGFEHPSLETSESLADARNTLSKFNSKDDAVIGYLQLQKAAGKPYKLPEAIDKLPDDKTRGEFISSIGRLMGAVENEDALKDIKWSPNGKPANEIMKSAFSKFAVENKMPKSLVQKLVDFTFNEQLVTDLQNQIKQQQEQSKLETAENVNKKLVELFGNKENVDKNTEFVRRMFQNEAGLTADEYKESAEGLINSGITQSAVLSKALFNLARKFAKEGETPGHHEPAPKEKTKQEKLIEELPNTAQALGWKK